MTDTMPSSQTHERSLILAEEARCNIQRLGLAPAPINYEIFYTYAARHNGALNVALERLLADGGIPSQRDLEALHDACLGPAGLTGKLDDIGSSINVELGDILGAIAGTADVTSVYHDKLGQASRHLDPASDPGSARSAVQALAAATREMHENSRQLKARLDSAMQEIASLQQGLQAIRNESRIDPLTEIANRKHLHETLERTIGKSAESGGPFSLLMIDIDHFKSFNDSFGHTTGDQVLRLVAATLKQNIRDQDLAARFGGEEFAIVLPDTPLAQAAALADRIRRAVMTRELKKRSTGQVIGRITISVGVAAWIADETSEALIERADKNLYAAKRGGRNRVVGSANSDTGSNARVAFA
ncbi:MAG: diguanylate cyclase [bacterium]|nr:diguanylate cyclase [bacterium]